MTSIERCPNPQMGPSRHPDIEAFITSMCNQARHHILSLACRKCLMAFLKLYIHAVPSA